MYNVTEIKNTEPLPGIMVPEEDLNIYREHLQVSSDNVKVSK